MVSNPPKVSFIPKNPLAREESFMERRRPRSITGFIAIFVFMASVGAYVGLRIYNASLTGDIKTKTSSINKTKAALAQSPEIVEAKIFRARTELAKDFLNTHVAISPVFDIIANNTLGSIEYSNFDFKRKDGSWQLELTGEAPSYASLAYQVDVLKKNTVDFNNFEISNIILTDIGSIRFTLAISFLQSQLSYISHSKERAPSFESSEIETPKGAATFIQPTTPVAPTSISDKPSTQPSLGEVTPEVLPGIESSFSTTSAVSDWTVSPPVDTPVVPSATTAVPTVTPESGSFWSWFKFW